MRDYAREQLLRQPPSVDSKLRNKCIHTKAQAAKTLAHDLLDPPSKCFSNMTFVMFFIKNELIHNPKKRWPIHHPGHS